MRTFLLLLMACLCAGCAKRDAEVAHKPAAQEPETAQTGEQTPPADARVVQEPDAPQAPAADPSATAPAEQPADAPQLPAAEPALLQPAPAAPLAEQPPAPPAMTKDEITALVHELVSAELAKQERQRVKLTAAQQEAPPQPKRAELDPDELTQTVIAAVTAAEAKAQQKAHEAAAERADAAAAAAKRDDEAIARFLLLPDELARVDRIKERLATDSIWSLTLQDLDFAAQGFAAPLLHDALYEAAGRCDENIEMDVLARDAQFTAEEKIQLATMPPIERQQLLMFTEQLEKGQKTVAADRYMREYIVRYPFIRKMLLEHIRKDQPVP